MSKRPKYTVRALVELPSTAVTLAKVAGLANISVEARSPRKRPDVIVVGGADLERGLAFTATWIDGKTDGAKVYRREASYELVVDDRPAHDARKPDPKHKGRTLPVANRKPEGIGTHRYLYRGGPKLPAHVGVNELLALLKGLQ
jgi:hypothetical protein